MKIPKSISAICWSLLIATGLQAQETPSYSYTTKGTQIFQAPGSDFMAKILVEAANLGSEEVKIAELTFPTGYSGNGHLHGAIEIFYVLKGRFGHSVNGVDAILEPGGIGIVKPGDTVTHSVHGDEAATVLTIWVPGGAGAPAFAGMPSRPIDDRD